jgi:hypothetical protein
MMARDPLDFFNDLPDFPGKTPPKNRSSKQSRSSQLDDRFNGAVGKVFKVNGEDRTFYSIGELAKCLRRKPVTIRMWEQQGWIPKATYRTPTPKGEQIPGKTLKGRRLYSLSQVEFLMDALEHFKIDDPNKANWDGFRKHIKNNWPN